MSINPVLALLALFALPTVLTSAWRPAVERAAQERGAPVEPAGPAPVRHRDHRGAGQGGARHRHRRPAGHGSAGRRGSAGTGRSPRPAARSAAWHTLAWAIFGGRLRRRDRVRRGRAARAGRRCAAGAGGRRPALGLHRRDRRRDRLPARHLDGRLAAAGVAGGLRGRHSSSAPTPPAPDRAAPTASGSSTSRSPTPARTGWCSTTSR